MRLCPCHAKRFVRAAIPILRNLPPLAGEADASTGKPSGGGGGASVDGRGDGNGANGKLSMAQASLGAAAAAVVAAERSAAAADTLLALHRPLEAFLRAGVAAGAAPGSTAARPCPPAVVATPRKRPRRRSFSEKTGEAGGSDGDGGVGGREDNQERLKRAGEARSAPGHVFEPATGATATAAASPPELAEVLLPRCIVPLFEAAAAAAGGKKTAVVAERREGGRGGESGRAERRGRRKGLLSCLEAVLEVSPRGGSGSKAAGVALGALRK